MAEFLIEDMVVDRFRFGGMCCADQGVEVQGAAAVYARGHKL
jgi:hypothetical protein